MNAFNFIIKNGCGCVRQIIREHRRHSTIFALSSGWVKSGVAVIRVSGNQSSQVITHMTKCTALPTPKMAILRKVYDPHTKEPLDKGILLWFPGPRSFTGEDVCELHVHGSKAVIQAILQALSKLENFKPAEPGEFTKRAFYAGKFDLTEIEGLSDLIDAETEMQRKQALYQMEGSLSQVYSNWRKSILQNLARVEAYIDFSEDENIEKNVLLRVRNEMLTLKDQILKHLNDFRKGEILRDGIKTVIIGSPNVGKSSLLNVICKRPVAIVTEIAGTTRDVVESTLNIAGYPVLLADTAGIRNDGSEDIVEKEGIRRSYSEANNANLIILLLDIKTIFPNEITSKSSSIQDYLFSYYRRYQKQLNVDQVLTRTKHIIVVNKIDLLSESERQILKECVKINFSELIFVSCNNGEGIAELMECMTKHFHEICGMPDKENPYCSRTRHRHHLMKSVENLNEVLEILSRGNEEDIAFAAEELRSASQHLGMITGAIATEEILDVIFHNFCIGK